MSSSAPPKRLILKDAPIHEALIKSGNNYFKNEYLIARLLLLLDDFHKAVFAVRPKIHYKGPWAKLPDIEIKILIEGVDKIIKDFCLTPNWENSIRQLILTSQLSVPPPIDPISLDSLNGQLVITITHNISITKLRKWIKQNLKNLEQELSKLPKVPKTKINSKTIFWGQIVAISRQKGLKSYPKIVRYIDEGINKGELEDLEELVGYPDEKDLENSYKALTKALSKQFKVDLP